MFERLATIGVEGSRLFRAEAEAVLIKARRSVVWGGAVVIGGSVALLAGLGLIVAAAAALAQTLGWIAALAIVSGVILLVGLVTFLLARAKLHQELRSDELPPDVQYERRSARTAIRENISPNGGDSSSAADKPSFEDRALEYATRNPAVVASAALCAVAALGPWRAFKVVARGVMLAGLATKVKSQLDQVRQHAGPSERFNGDSPT